MFRYLKAIIRYLTYPGPWGTLALAAFGLVAVALAGVRNQWPAAQAALAEGQPREARSHLDICLFVWPRDVEVRRLAARAARMTGDVQAAEAHLKQCLKLQGEATQAVQLEFLLLRVQMGEVDEVVGTLMDCVEKKHAEAPLILETLTGAYIHRFRYKAAYAFLTAWIELQPGAAKAYQLRGWVLERLNHHKQAVKDYDRALEQNPNLLTIRLRVAEILLEEKRAPEAVPHLERLYRQAPDHPEVLARLGMCRFFQNRSAEARQLMEAAVVRLPDDPSLLISLARLDLQEGRASDAERRLRHILKADRSDTEALYSLVSALQVQGRTTEATSTLKEYQWFKDRVARINTLLRDVVDTPAARAADFAEVGDLLLQVGRERQGVYWLEQALEREPSHQTAHKALAAHYDKKGDQEHAAAHRRWLKKE